MTEQDQPRQHTNVNNAILSAKESTYTVTTRDSSVIHIIKVGIPKLLYFFIFIFMALVVWLRI